MNKASPETLLSTKNISIQFADTQVLFQVNLDIHAGEIHAIVGENGAGKSTLMKILQGLYQPTEGEIIFKNQSFDSLTPPQAFKLGIGMVHQHFMQADELNVLENLALFEKETFSQDFFSGFKFLNLRKLEEKYKKIIQDFNLKVDLQQKISKLSVVQKQQIEIMKVLVLNPELIIFDEPTAVLTPQESDELFGKFIELKKMGKSIIFITHKLKEVKAVADRVTVIRHGRVVSKFETATSQELAWAQAMIGASTDNPSLEPESKFATEVSLRHEVNYHIDQLKASNRKESLDIKNFNFYKGRITCLLGVEGNGQNLLIEKLLSPPHRLKLQKLSLGILPADRLKDGLFSTWPLWKDFLLTHIMKRPNRPWLLSRGSASQGLLELIQKFDVRPLAIEKKLSEFSGGNQQKYVVARELHLQPQVLIASHPTRGVDFLAIQKIHKSLFDLKVNGGSVLLVTSDIDEALSLSDEIHILYKGRIHKTFQRSDFSITAIGQAMGGL